MSPFYEDALDVISVWHVLNWFMALGIVLALAVTYVHRREADPDARGCACADAAFYAAATLAILFSWNWFDDLTAGEGGQSPNRGYFWVIINTTFVMLLGALSARLWKDSPGE